MNDEIYCYEPFASHNSLNENYLVAVISVCWVLHDIEFKSENDAIKVANNYINEVIYGQKEG